MGVLVTSMISGRVIALMMCAFDILGDRVPAFMVGAPVTCLVGDGVSLGMQ